MATIRLASAIGEQRKPVDVLGGVGDAIKSTGDVIIRDIQQKKAAEQKGRDIAFDEAMKSISTTIDAVPKDQETYRQVAAKGISDLKNMWLNGAKKAEIIQKNEELKNILKPMQLRFEEDAKGVAKFFTDYKPEWNKEENRYTSDKYEFSDAESILTGASRGQVPMVKDAPVRDMPVNKQDADVTEVTDVQNKGYFDLPIEERKKLYPNGAYTALSQATKDITGNFNDASLGYFGKDWSPKDQYSNVVTTENADGLDVEKVVIDENKIARDKAAFLSSAGTDLGDAKTKQYFRTLANKAGAAGKRAGLQGEELNTFVKDNVLKAAAQDFDNRVLQDIEKTKIKTIDKDPDKVAKDSKGFSINVGGGGENALWKFGKPVKTNIREGATFKMIPSKEKGGEPVKTPVKKGDLKEYEYISMQTKTPASNPAMVINGESVYYQGVVKEVGGDKVVKFKFNTKADDGGEDRFIPVGKLNPSTISDIKTNVGEDDFEKAAAIGDYAPKKEISKKTEYKQLKEYGGHTYGRNSATDEWKKIK